MLNGSGSLYRRMYVLRRILDHRNPREFISFRPCSSMDKDPSSGVRVINIGGVIKTVKEAKNPQLVPRKYVPSDIDQDTLHHLRWMLQKDNLQQDIFLVGRPGPSKRRLAMQFLELTEREIEFVSLSRDTTEADLKQRREIQESTAKYIDQSAVRAAVEGRVLILEGIEKAERNVLPVLNNLLENREMHLEDGRFLVSAERYDQLAQEHGEEELKKWRLIKVSKDFRVIALGLPVPGFQGNPLDPPLRSRFQARDVPPPSYHETLEHLKQTTSVDEEKLNTLLSCSYGLLSPESTSLGLPDFPLHNIPSAVKMLELFPWLNVKEVLERLYPSKYMLTNEGCTNVKSILDSFNVRDSCIGGRVKSAQCSQTSASVSLTADNVDCQITVPCGPGQSSELDNYVQVNYHEELLRGLIESHAVGDFCILGPRGCGKSTLAMRFARLLGYTVEPISLYQDMTARDLIQQRATRDNGDTYWKNSPLVTAALEGKTAVLDGLQRVHPSTISTLHRLVHDRELQLHDGKRLLRHDRYDELASTYGEHTMNDLGIFRIHPSFRIIALAEPVALNAAPWLTPELLGLFIYHQMRPLTIEEELHIIKSMFSKVPRPVQSVLHVADSLRNSKDPTLVSLSNSLSTRQLIRIAKRLCSFEGQQPYEIIQAACLSMFLPPMAKKTLDTILERAGLVASDSTQFGRIEMGDGEVTIGRTKATICETSVPSKVPNIQFYDLPQHVGALERLLQDFLLGEHILLIGNQGVGKNKLTDKLLQLLNRPREYIQLHRDTTVQTLTLQPTVKDGVVTYEDSPLVTAVKNGHVLVVDEADKAPTHVTCILKTLVESGEMILSDGRRIVPSSDPRVALQKEGIIPIHPEFRMMVLANRPGFPFLGNDFFGALGDLFSVHSVDNPSRESEIQLLRNYGPDVPLDVIHQLVGAFGKLRSLADQGLVSYPYSTRELVNVVKHLQVYPTDSLSDAVGNVFDFDRYSSEAREALLEVLSEYKIPVALTAEDRARSRKKIQMTVERDSGLDVSSPKHGKEDEKNEPHVGGNTWAGGTGGRDTAGLGGKGGPYRLDKGHDVHQLSDEEKAAVLEHVRKAAREMNRKAFQARLDEIKMSSYEASLYEQFSGAVSKQVQALRVILNSLQAKSKERQWHRHQTSGELDDSKLIEGIIGERTIYRRRGEKEPEMGAPQLKPKRLKLVVDVSGSMYRFNGYDGRLDRELEAVIMVTESFQGFESRFQYDIIGHSGESKSIKFVDKSNPPTDNKQRLEIIRLMHAHSQFCESGDYTLEATESAVKSLAEEDSDEAIVVVLSDANLSRYAIPVKELAQALTCDPRVNAYAVFIGSLGNEASRLCNALPAGKGYLCLDLKNLPQILQNIFTSSMLKS